MVDISKYIDELNIPEIVDSYEYRGDDGDYKPNENEMALMEDFSYTLLSELTDVVNNFDKKQETTIDESKNNLYVVTCVAHKREDNGSLTYGYRSRVVSGVSKEEAIGKMLSDLTENGDSVAIGDKSYTYEKFGTINIKKQHFIEYDVNFE